MANFETLKTAIDANINTNGKQAITGSVVNNVMHQMVDATSEQLTELEYYAGVQSDLNIKFTDKEDGSIDITFTNRVIFIKKGHSGFNLNFDQYPTTFNLPRYNTLALDIVTQEVKVENYGDGKDTPNRLVLLHNEPQGVFNGVFAPLYNFPKLGQYKAIDEGGSVISPYSSISIRKGDGSNLIVKFSAAKYNIINDYGSNPSFTIDAGTELILPSYGAIFADIASRKIILSDGYYPRESKQILLAYNEGGVIYSGLLKGLYDKTFNDASALIEQERSFFDMAYSVKKTNTWVSDTNVETTNDSNFSMYEYEVGENTKMQLFVAMGGGYVIFIDDNGNVLSSYRHAQSSYTSQWAELDVPSGATKLKITQAVKNTLHPYAEPIRVRGNHTSADLLGKSSLNLVGKKVVFFGDSITEMGHYVNAFQKMTGCDVVNRGASGTCFTKTTGRGYNDSLSERIDLPSSDAVGFKLGLPSKADLVIVLAGVNDWGQKNSWEIDLGNIEDDASQTNFTSAAKYVFSKLREKYPSTPIVALSMLHTYHPTQTRAWREITFANGQYGGGFTYDKDKDGNTMDVWRKRVGDAARFYGIPFVDMTQCGFSPFLESDNTAFMPDGLHPNEAGGQIMAKYIISQLKALFDL